MGWSEYIAFLLFGFRERMDLWYVELRILILFLYFEYLVYLSIFGYPDTKVVVFGIFKLDGYLQTIVIGSS